MTAEWSFAGCAIVSCGTLRDELRALQDEGFLDAEGILFTAPGLHESPGELEEQLGRQLARAAETAGKTIVAYGSRCFVDYSDPSRDIDTVIREQGRPARRVPALNCVDMLADAQQRERLADGQKVYWLTPGWLKHWRYIFRDWDTGKANETFPQNDSALMLDGIGFFQRHSQEKPEEVLAFSDWMGIPIEPVAVSLDRLRNLLLQTLQ
ncbi:MAG: DUF1638 domain-containing protein [Candidatus Brocadiaceae bacterium]